MSTLDVRVAAVRAEAQGVKAFVLESLTGAPLPPFAPGAHVEVRAPRARTGDAWRAYSIASDPADTQVYEIGVLRAGEVGVSAWLHDQVSAGDVVTARAPHNGFPLAETAAEHVLLAGGIGITPLLAMARWLERRGGRYRLVASARSPERLAFRGALARLAADRVRLHYSGSEGRLDLAAAIGAPASGRHLSVCGPNAMVQEARRAARELGWDDGVRVAREHAAAGDRSLSVGPAARGTKPRPRGRSSCDDEPAITGGQGGAGGRGLGGPAGKRQNAVWTRAGSAAAVSRRGRQGHP